MLCTMMMPHIMWDCSDNGGYQDCVCDYGNDGDGYDYEDDGGGYKYDNTPRTTSTRTRLFTLITPTSFICFFTNQIVHTSIHDSRSLVVWGGVVARVRNPLLRITSHYSMCHD